MTDNIKMVTKIITNNPVFGDTFKECIHADRNNGHRYTQYLSLGTHVMVI